MSETNRKVDVVVHVEELLEEANRAALTANLQKTNGIYAAEFCPLRYHLMVIQYDREQMKSQDVLQHVINNHVNARLIGPI